MIQVQLLEAELRPLGQIIPPSVREKRAWGSGERLAPLTVAPKDNA